MTTQHEPAELRRLYAENQELLGALKWISEYIAESPPQLRETHKWNEIARAVIAKAQGDNT